MPKIKSIKKVKPTFSDVRQWFDEHLLVDKIDLDDKEAYKVYEEARVVGIFQCIVGDSQILLKSGLTKRIDQIIINDEVVSLNENNEFVFSKVINVFDQGERDCIELSFSNGKTLICTDDHLIMTQRGWIQAKDLSSYDEIIGKDTI
jgi:hypothetical protein